MENVKIMGMKLFVISCAFLVALEINIQKKLALDQAWDTHPEFIYESRPSTEWQSFAAIIPSKPVDLYRRKLRSSTRSFFHNLRSPIIAEKAEKVVFYKFLQCISGRFYLWSCKRFQKRRILFIYSRYLISFADFLIPLRDCSSSLSRDFWTSKNNFFKNVIAKFCL